MRRWWWVVIVLVLLGAPLAWYVGSPLFLNKIVNEPFPTVGTGPKEFPMSAGATVPEGMTKQQVEDAMMEASRANASASDPTPKGTTAATVVVHGTFAGRDDFHKGEGTATVHRIGQNRILRLDPFRVTNGPDLHLILTKHPAPKTPTDVQQGYIEVAKLRGNVGSQNYTLEERVRLEEYRAVVIYCMRFHVVFSTASLRAAE